MARPTGWDILGLDGDPTPGVVESVQALAKEFGDFAHDVEAAYRSLNSFGSDASALQWIGQTADAFKGQFGPLPGRLQKLYTSYSEASDALSAYAPALQAAQSKADAALRQAQDAHADLQRATTNADSAAADLKTAQQNQAANPDQKAVSDAQTAHDSAQTNLNSAKARMADLTKQANDAYNDRINAAKTCASALHRAQGDGIHNKSWWDHVAEDLSKWGGEIADIANELAPFLDVLALATSWIPGVDVITAALAEADNIIALVGTGMKVAGDAMQGHWGDALLGIGMLGAQYLGGKMIEKFGGKLIEKIGARGNKLACEGGDPVDVVSGNMITAEADVVLPGILPLVLRRAYSSAHSYGRLFGAGWSSTLDVRVCINAAGIHFAGDDSQILHYAIPEPGQSVMPQDGARWPLEWDRDTDEIRVTDPVSAFVWRFAVVHHREDAGEIRDLTSVTDRNDNEVRFLRDEFGTPIVVEHGGGYRLLVDSVATSVGPRIRGLRLADGTSQGVTVRTFGYDQHGRLTDVVNSSGEPFRYEYDAADRITAWQDRLGYRYAYEYDETGRVWRGTGDGGFLSAIFEYDDENQTNTVVDSLGRRIVYRYDDNGNIASITDPLGHTLTSVHDRYGRLISGTDALGRTTNREYDEFGNTTRITRPDGTEITGAFVAAAKPVEVCLPDGSKWRYRYDDRGRLTAVIDPAEAETRYQYDARGGVREVVDPLGAVTRITTDGTGLPVLIEESDDGTTHLERDAFGRIVSVTQPDGVTVTAGWSVEGLNLWEAGPDGVVTSRAYDDEGRLLAHTDALGAVTRFEYGPFGTTVARTDPSGARYEFAYDTELTLTSVRNPAGAVWSYDYDAGGRLVAERDFTGRELHYRHDAGGRLIARVNGLGQTTELSYGALGEILQRSTADGVYAFEYDRAGRLVTAAGPGAALSFTRDEVGRITAETLNGRTVGFTYDVAGRRIQRTTPSGAQSAWDYDVDLNHARLTTSSGALEFAFDAVGRETARAFGADVRLTQGFDAEGRLTEQKLWRGDAPSDALMPAQLLMERTYSYRADNTPVRISDSLRGTREYGLDRLGRVVAVQAATWNESYAYDEFGNVAHAAAPGGPDSGDPSAAEREFAGPLARRAGRTHYEHDGQGRLVRATRRTLSGQRKQWTYRWDADDRLVQASLPDGVVWTYSYDPLGRRTGKEAVDADGALLEQVEFSWDGGTLIEQVSRRGDSGEAVTWDYDPLMEPWRPVAQRRRRWTENGQQDGEEAFHTVVTDAAGTPAELVAADGSIAWHLTTSLFGTPAAVSEHDVDCPLRFPGQYLDEETGLHYNVHRYYDPQTASYLSPDPLGLAPSPNDHGYAPNPLTEIDPLGLLCDTALAGIKDRVDTLHALNGGGSGYRTTAIIRALDHNGKEVDVVGWSGPADKALNPKIVNALGNNGRNEIPAMAVDGDAEVTALATIRANGWTPLGGAASRPVCPWCQNELFEPFSATVGGVQLRGPFDFTQIKMRPGKGGTIASHPLGGRLSGQSQFTW